MHTSPNEAKRRPSGENFTHLIGLASLVMILK
jgi:hypothetical protein